MGIRRLTQDLQQYSEAGVLDGNPENVPRDEIAISKVVIDGPSLVYHIYFGLLGQMTSAELSAAMVPTYKAVIRSVRSVLADLRERGVEILAVLFDGHLPSSKRAVRIERMENARRQLDTFRRINSELSPHTARTERLGEMIWGLDEFQQSNVHLALPYLPLLCPAVVEASRQYSDLGGFQVVPDEADVACARIARRSGAAVLTNDSDLPLYDLGPKGCVVSLRSVKTTEVTVQEPTRVASKEQKADSRLICSCFRPAHVAQRLAIPSFLHFGFERFIDSTVTAAGIRDRARSASIQYGRRQQFQAFAAQFQITNQPASPSNMSSLDTRLAEFVQQVTLSSEPALVYLPLLHEDPLRDSAWIYGQAYRQVAYSLIYLHHHRKPPDSVVEHVRKGARVTAMSLPILRGVHLESGINTTSQNLVIATSDRNGLHNTQGNKQSQSYLSSVTEWYEAAIFTVLHHKLNANKSLFPSIAVDRLFGLAFKTSFKSTWDDIHLLANVHSVLYSWRILGQILDLISSAANPTNYQSQISGHILHLRACLSRMPPISDLFLQLDEFRSTGGLAERRTAAERVKWYLEMHLESHWNEGVSAQARQSVEVRNARATARAPVRREKSVKLRTNAFCLLVDEGDGDTD